MNFRRNLFASLEIYFRQGVFILEELFFLSIHILSKNLQSPDKKEKKKTMKIEYEQYIG